MSGKVYPARERVSRQTREDLFGRNISVYRNLPFTVDAGTDITNYGIKKI
jgi:hypothetical protein